MGHSPELLDELNTHLEDGAPIAATSCSPPVTALRSPATLPHPRPRPDTRSQSVMSQLQRPTHDFRPAPVSWLLAGGSDLRSAMDSMHDSLIHTTHSYLALPDADHATSTPTTQPRRLPTHRRRRGLRRSMAVSARAVSAPFDPRRRVRLHRWLRVRWKFRFLRASWLCSDEPSVDLRAEPGERVTPRCRDMSSRSASSRCMRLSSHRDRRCNGQQVLDPRAHVVLPGRQHEPDPEHAGLVDDVTDPKPSDGQPVQQALGCVDGVHRLSRGH
jgi:hypothetical protein